MAIPALGNVFSRTIQTVATVFGLADIKAEAIAIQEAVENLLPLLDAKRGAST